MVWLLLTAFILLGQQYYFLRCDLNDVATENRILQRLAAQRYNNWKTCRRRHRAAVEQAKLWSKRALSLGFHRRAYKIQVRQQRKQNDT